MGSYYCSKCGANVSINTEQCPNCKSLLSGVSDGDEKRRKELQRQYREQKREDRRDKINNITAWFGDYWVHILVTGLIISLFTGFIIIIKPVFSIQFLSSSDHNWWPLIIFLAIGLIISSIWGLIRWADYSLFAGVKSFFKVMGIYILVCGLIILPFKGIAFLFNSQSIWVVRGSILFFSFIASLHCVNISDIWYGYKSDIKPNGLWCNTPWKRLKVTIKYITKLIIIFVSSFILSILFCILISLPFKGLTWALSVLGVN